MEIRVGEVVNRSGVRVVVDHDRDHGDFVKEYPVPFSVETRTTVRPPLRLEETKGQGPVLSLLPPFSFPGSLLMSPTIYWIKTRGVGTRVGWTDPKTKLTQ